MASGAELSVLLLSRAGVATGPGLTEQELHRIEREFRFRFDEDHRELLSLVTPLDAGWFDWRTATSEQVREHLAWPIDGVLWDVHNNEYWPRAWGRRPGNAKSRDRKAKARLRKAPTLIPIFGHRYMAAGPSGGSSPVFSVMQTDVIYYGENLPSYIAHELEIPKRYATGVKRHIPFWSALAEGDPNYFDWPSDKALKFRNQGADGEPILNPFTAEGHPKDWEVNQIPPGRDRWDVYLEVMERRRSAKHDGLGNPEEPEAGRGERPDDHDNEERRP